MYLFKTSKVKFRIKWTLFLNAISMRSQRNPHSLSRLIQCLPERLVPELHLRSWQSTLVCCWQQPERVATAASQGLTVELFRSHAQAAISCRTKNWSLTKQCLAIIIVADAFRSTDTLIICNQLILTNCCFECVMESMTKFFCHWIRLCRQQTSK